MFESAELGHKIKKSVYEKEVPLLREALLNTQIELAESARFPVIILIGGLDGAGRGETVNLLSSWMDPRHIQTHGMGEPSDEELDRPMMWRFSMFNLSAAISELVKSSNGLRPNSSKRLSPLSTFWKSLPTLVDEFVPTCVLP